MLRLVRNGRDIGLDSFVSGAHLGHGAFETFILRISKKRDNNEGYVVGLDLHLQRLKRAIDFFSLINVNDGQVLQILRELRDRYDSNLKIRVMTFPNDWYVSVEQGSDLNLTTEIKVVRYDGERYLPEYKTSSALLSVMASKYARSNGAYESLLVDSRGIVREGAWSNFFWIDNSGEVFTQPDKVLPGVTREFILKNPSGKYKINLKEVTWNELLEKSQCIFLTQSTHGIIPVNKIADKQLEDPYSNPTFLELNKNYLTCQLTKI